MFHLIWVLIIGGIIGAIAGGGFPVHYRSDHPCCHRIAYSWSRKKRKLNIA